MYWLAQKGQLALVNNVQISIIVALGYVFTITVLIKTQWEVVTLQK